jgi:hypothetical protein
VVGLEGEKRSSWAGKIEGFDPLVCAVVWVLWRLRRGVAGGVLKRKTKKVAVLLSVLWLSRSPLLFDNSCNPTTNVVFLSSFDEDAMASKFPHCLDKHAHPSPILSPCTWYQQTKDVFLDL